MSPAISLGEAACCGWLDSRLFAIEVVTSCTEDASSPSWHVTVTSEFVRFLGQELLKRLKFKWPSRKVRTKESIFSNFNQKRCQRSFTYLRSTWWSLRHGIGHSQLYSDSENSFLKSIINRKTWSDKLVNLLANKFGLSSTCWPKLKYPERLPQTRWFSVTFTNNFTNISQAFDDFCWDEKVYLCSLLSRVVCRWRHLKRHKTLLITHLPTTPFSWFPCLASWSAAAHIWMKVCNKKQH